MRMFTIEVDEEVFAYLQAKAQAFVDTPNTVLRQELLTRQRTLGMTDGSGAEHVHTGRATQQPGPDFPTMPFGTPAALQQILWVVYLVLKKGHPRTEATSRVAKVLHVAPQTVLDKYCRQLGLTAEAFDRMLREPDLQRIEHLLVAKFVGHTDTIRSILSMGQNAA